MFAEVDILFDARPTLHSLNPGQSGCDASHYTYNPNAGGNLDQANGYTFNTFTIINGQPLYGYAYFMTKGTRFVTVISVALSHPFQKTGFGKLFFYRLSVYHAGLLWHEGMHVLPARK